MTGMRALRIVAICGAVCVPAVSGDAARAQAPAAYSGETRVGETTSLALTHADHERTFLLHLPTGFQPGTPVPLVIAIHGLGMDGQGMRVFTGFDDVADEHGFAVAYPDGLGRMWRFWERHELGARVRRERGYVDDVGYIAAIIDALTAKGIVEPRRVYASGLSNGAYMSNRLGCALPDKIAAIAPVAGTMVAAQAGQNPSRPMPVLYIHGANDRIVGFDGVDTFSRNKSSLTAPELVAWWVRHNGGSEPLATETIDSADDGCRVQRIVYPASPGGAVVEFYKIEGGGHTWPDGFRQPTAVMGTVCRDFSASEVMWEFFSQHQLPEPANSPVGGE